MSRDHKRATLRIADAATGAVRIILEEEESTFYESAATAGHALSEKVLGNWRLLDESNEVIWYSARDGWNHLYLYDLSTGNLKRQITSGRWNIVKLSQVDEAGRRLYFQAVGRERDSNPYFEDLYSIGMDGKNLTHLTPEDATHDVTMSPTSGYFLDSYSTPEAPPVSVLRDRDGELVLPLETTDISALTAKGWKPPIPITVKARDGVTDLYGLMFTPSTLDENGKYPIINAIYPGPQIGSTFGKVASFVTSYGLGDPQSLAELGFVVVMIDGMGTPLRSREFGEATYGDYADSTLPDQIAGMRELARGHPWIDLDRAGIYGLSGGGYAAARAMFAYPEFFSVGVAMSGNHDPSLYMDEFSEKYVGLLDQDGEGLANYADQSNIGLAGNLEGRLLLVHGTMDDNVPPYHTLLLVDALIKENKDFDLLMLPNQRHNAVAGASGRYLVRRYWDYFVRYLLGAEPPREYQMEPVAN
jgi:dipeptidyl aminopeptidase/acylaminoacyl peptidase